jgi:hypothetical protein
MYNRPGADIVIHKKSFSFCVSAFSRPLLPFAFNLWAFASFLPGSFCFN